MLTHKILFKHINMSKKLLKVVASGLTALMLAGVLPLTGLAFSTLNLVSATAVTQSIYTLEVQAVGVPADGAVQYRTQTGSWAAMTQDSGQTDHYLASDLTLAEGDNLYTVRIADVAASTLVQSDYTVAYTANFHLVSDATTSMSPYTFLVDVDSVPFLGKVQYRSAGLLALWIDMAKDGANYTATTSSLNDGVNHLAVRTLYANGTVASEDTMTVNYIPYELALTSATSSTLSTYPLTVTATAANLADKLVQFRVTSAIVPTWITMTAQGNDSFTHDLNLAEGANTIEVRIADNNGTELFKANYTITYHQSVTLPLDTYTLELTSATTSSVATYLLAVKATAEYDNPISKLVQFRVTAAIVPTWITMTAQGNDSFTHDLNLAEGANTIEVRIAEQDATELVKANYTITYNRSIVLPGDPTCVHNDLPETYQYCDAIHFNYDLGTFTGDGNGNFRGSDGVLRAEAAKILNVAKKVNLSAYTNTGNGGFSDTIAGSWYMKYLKASKDNGVITGYPNGTFGPSNTVIRAEFAVMVTRALGINLDGACDADYASDIAADTYWETSACYLVKNNYLNLANGKFNPTEPMTREDIARMLFAMESHFTL